MAIRSYLPGRLARTFALIASLAVAALCPAFGASRSGTAVLAQAQELAPATALSTLLEGRSWLNTPPLKPEDVRGRVVLVNFWTYSCINVMRALPYVRTWAEKYRDHGLIVVGVHTPEFTFERDVTNVRKALPALGVSYPVVLDNDARIWRGFDNQYWPALYLIDAAGRVRYRSFGEGSYDRCERAIQSLLSEASGQPVDLEIKALNGTGLQAPADWRHLRSEESYVGYAQAKNFASPDGIRNDAPTLYRAVPALPLNAWSLAGTWAVGSEFAALTGNPGSIRYRFHARDLHLVLAPPPIGHPVRFRVQLNGAPPGADHGVDVDEQGWGTVQEPRLYQLVRQQERIADRTFEIEFFDEGVRAYSFTFG